MGRYYHQGAAYGAEIIVEPEMNAWEFNRLVRSFSKLTFVSKLDLVIFNSKDHTTFESLNVIYPQMNRKWYPQNKLAPSTLVDIALTEDEITEYERFKDAVVSSGGQMGKTSWYNISYIDD